MPAEPSELRASLRREGPKPPSESQEGRYYHRLWQDDTEDAAILPASLPLYDGSSRNELVYYLPPGWDAVMAARARKAAEAS